MDINNLGVALVWPNTILREGQAPELISGMAGYGIADDGAVFGSTGHYDANSACLTWTEAATYRGGAIQHFTGVFGPVGCYRSTGLGRADSFGLRVAGFSSEALEYPCNPLEEPCRPTDELWRATLWSGGAPVSLHPAGASVSVAHDVNDQGTAAGWANFTGVIQAAKWGPGGGFSSMGIGTAYVLNNHGEAIGRTNLGNYLAAEFSVLWLPAPAYGLRPGIHAIPSVTTGEAVVAQDINDAGQIVGHTHSANHPGERGWLWVNGTTHDLNDLIAPESLYKIFRAYAINELGQIACEAILNGDPLDYAYVLLTPEG
jgi:probable HAF family extracellular repeat protein